MYRYVVATGLFGCVVLALLAGSGLSITAQPGSRTLIGLVHGVAPGPANAGPDQAVVDGRAEIAKVDKGQGAPTLKKTRDSGDPGPEVPWGEGDRKEFKQFPPGALEAFVETPDFLPVYFLEMGVVRQRSVGRVTLKQNVGGLHPGAGFATGFLVSPKSLFLTNNHVISDPNFAQNVFVSFNYQYGPDGKMMAAIDYEFAPGDFFYTNPSLDYTVIRLKRADPAQTAGGPANGGLGFISIAKPVDYMKEAVSIIVQHPRGRPKEIALQNNIIKHIYKDRIRYTTDTEPGSSGSPVFNFNWDLIGLHHAAGDEVDGKYVDNEGIKINSIIADLKKQFGADVSKREILIELGIAP